MAGPGMGGVPLVPGLVRVAWAILSLQGFRSHRVRIPWPQFEGAAVSGFPNMFVLNGPHATLGHNSSLLMIEAQVDYLLGDPSKAKKVLEWEPKTTFAELTNEKEPVALDVSWNR